MNQQNKTERWVERYSKIMLEWIESQWKIEQAHQAGEPYTRMKFEADANKVEIKLTDFISQLLSDARREERERCLEALPKPRIMINNVPDSDLVVGWNGCLKESKEKLLTLK